MLGNPSVVKVFQDYEHRWFRLCFLAGLLRRDRVAEEPTRATFNYAVGVEVDHVKRCGEPLDADDRAIHLAGGPTDAGHPTMLSDIRQYFGHGRRWYVRLGGLEHFESVRPSIGLYLGTRRLQTYYGPPGDRRVFL